MPMAIRFFLPCDGGLQSASLMRYAHDRLLLTNPPVSRSVETPSTQSEPGATGSSAGWPSLEGVAGGCRLA